MVGEIPGHLRVVVLSYIKHGACTGRVETFGYSCTSRIRANPLKQGAPVTGNN